LPTQPPLPPGQREQREFSRFGLSRYAQRFPHTLDRIDIRIGGDVAQAITLASEWSHLPRTTLTADFHCVTTWTVRALEWRGVRFRDVFDGVIARSARPQSDVAYVVFRCQDGYRTMLTLADALAHDVLLADTLNGKPLSMEHGAPVRLVAPAHYGYKNAKHVDRIELWSSAAKYVPVGPRFVEHPRARVAFEERARYVPGWILRYLYRPLIAPTLAKFKRASVSRERSTSLDPHDDARLR